MTENIAPVPRKPAVQVFIRRHFGRTDAYPANRAADLLMKLTGKGTLWTDHLQIIEELGYEVEVVPDPSFQPTKTAP